MQGTALRRVAESTASGAWVCRALGAGLIAHKQTQQADRANGGAWAVVKPADAELQGSLTAHSGGQRGQYWIPNVAPARTRQEQPEAAC